MLVLRPSVGGAAVMSEYWVRLDAYLQDNNIDSAVERAVDALSGIAVQVLVVDKEPTGD